MRTVKYRGKTIHARTWIYGSLLLLSDKAYIVENFEGACPKNCILNEVAKDSVGQLIGLFDKKKKEIYENDIYSAPRPAYTNKPYIPGEVDYIVIEWNEEYAAFVYRMEEWDEGCDVCTRNMGDITICGNLTDNPQLFKITNQ